MGMKSFPSILKLGNASFLKIAIFSRTLYRFFSIFLFFKEKNFNLLFYQSELIIFINLLIYFCISIMWTVREQRHSFTVQPQGIPEKFIETFRDLKLG